MPDRRPLNGARTRSRIAEEAPLAGHRHRSPPLPRDKTADSCERAQPREVPPTDEPDIKTSGLRPTTPERSAEAKWRFGLAIAAAPAFAARAAFAAVATTVAAIAIAAA